ncbi:MAG: hypothetical protein U0524_03715 [Candidatus Saccharimonadales bacterium]
MSEKIKTIDPETPPLDQETLELDVAELEQTEMHEINNPVEVTQEFPAEHQEQEIAVGGIRQAIRGVREWRARRVIAKMDRKDAFYDYLSARSQGLVGKDPQTKERGGHTIVERILDARMEKRRDKAIREAVYAYRDAITYGEDYTEPVLSIRHGAERAFYDRLPGSTNAESARIEAVKAKEEEKRKTSEVSKKQESRAGNKSGGKNGKEADKEKKQKPIETGTQLLRRSERERDTMGRVLWLNTKRLIFGPQPEPGSKRESPISRKLKSIAVASRFITGEFSAYETRRKLTEIGARRVNFGRHAHRKSRWHSRKATERFHVAAEQPIAARWRDVRRGHAQGVIERIEAEREAERQAAKRKGNRKQRPSKHSHARGNQRRQHA